MSRDAEPTFLATPDRRTPEDIINTLTEERDSLSELLAVEQQRGVMLTAENKMLTSWNDTLASALSTMRAQHQAFKSYQRTLTEAVLDITKEPK